MRHFVLALIILSVTSEVLAQQNDIDITGTFNTVNGGRLFYDLDFVHCTIGFTVGHMGISKVSGTFSEFKGAVVYNPDDLKKLSTAFVIDVGSINTNQVWRDKDLQSEKWFDKENHPYILFQSDEVILTNNGFDWKGKLTMKGITKDITLNMKKPSGYVRSYLGYHLAFNGSTRVNRKDFSIGENTWWNDIIEGIAQLEEFVDINLSIAYQLQTPEFIKSRFYENEAAIYKAFSEGNTDHALSVFIAQKEAYDRKDDKTNKNFDAITGQDLNTVAKVLTMEGKREQAERLLLFNMKSFPEDDSVLIELAGLYLKNRQLDKAKNMILKCLSLNPLNTVALELQRGLIN